MASELDGWGAGVATGRMIRRGIGGTPGMGVAAGAPRLVSGVPDSGIGGGGAIGPAGGTGAVEATATVEVVD